MINFSFVVPVYNGADYIQKCVNSILSVERDDYEVIVVNDGSTDKTAEILTNLYGDNDIVRIVHRENGGLSVARNTGTDMARGKYLIYIDSDDWIGKEMDKPMSVMLKEDPDMCFYNANNVFAEENYDTWGQERYPFDENETYTGDDVLRQYKERWIPNEVWHGIYKKSFMDEHSIRFIPGVLYEDNSFWFDIMRFGKRIKYLNTYCYNYLIRPGSIAFSDSKEKNIQSVFTLMKHILKDETYSDDYLGCAAVKLPKLMRACEKRIDVSRLDGMLENCPDVWKDKAELLKRIDSLYSEDTLCKMINKYILLSEFSFFAGIYDKEDEERVYAIRNRVIGALRGIMDAWPLGDKTKTVGIYGSGRNSDVLLNIYEKIYGEIKAKVYYIDSSKESGIYKHLNREIVNVSDVAGYGIEQIVICSNRYEEQMYKKAKEMYPQMPVYRIYNGETFIAENILTDNFAELVFEYRKAEREGKKRIILLETPEYPNIGDHLIAYAEKKMLDTYGNGRTIIEVTNENAYFFKGRLKKLISKEDVLVITGGGYFGTLWREAHYNEALGIIKTYRDNDVVVMPQSVYFSGDELGERYRKLTTELFNRDRLKVFLREQFSYELLKEIGVRPENIAVVPDIVLSLDISEVNKRVENRIGFFIRHDKESVTDSGAYEYLKKCVAEKNMEWSDSSMQYPFFVFKEDRMKAIDEKLDEIYNRYDLVVTDQLHCMITCALLRKPCVAFCSRSKKTEGVYRWLSDLNYVCIVKNADEAAEKLDELLGLDRSEYDGYIKEECWNELYKELKRVM